VTSTSPARDGALVGCVRHAVERRGLKRARRETGYTVKGLGERVKRGREWNQEGT
jgi:hypothetical protein